MGVFFILKKLKGMILMDKRQYIENIFSDGLMGLVGETAEEIRIRINEPVIIIYPDREAVTDIVYRRPQIDSIMDRITKSSFYTFSEDIANGFITIAGGHRIGVVGTAVYENGSLKTLRDISYINVRIAHELKGVGEGMFAKISKGDKVSSTLIVSPPGGGKTTLIRDLARLISDNIQKYRVAVIDERNEISASFMGEPQNDVGKRTDILCGYSKKDGISRALRSMSPNLIILDEIGGQSDADAIIRCKYSGVGVIATMHGNDISDIKRNIPELMENEIFNYCVFLKKNRRECKIMTAGDIYD